MTISLLFRNRGTSLHSHTPLRSTLGYFSTTIAMSTSTSAPAIDPAALASFQAHLAKSTRILALLGAGLSAASGLPTFRGAGGMWRNHEATSLATPDAFDDDPGLVWQFYSYRRHMALQAKPNPAHFALAELARKKEGFITISQNVDGLSQRASHPPSQLYLLHGNLFDVKCWNEECDYFDQNNLSDPIVPTLEVSAENDPMPSKSDKTGAEAGSALAAAMGSIDAPKIPEKDLPHCPKCSDLLRPGVVWFDELLPEDTLNTVDAWIQDEKVDLMLVIGTAAAVYPAAGYVSKARHRGARIAVINMDDGDLGATGSLRKDRDWMFQGDAGVILPELFRGVIGDLDVK